MDNPLLFQWGLSAVHGWGVYGLNLMRYWPMVSGGSPAFCGAIVDHASLAGMSPLDRAQLAGPIAASEYLLPRLERRQGGSGYFAGIVLHSLGNRFGGALTPKAGGIVGGRGTCGVIFAEDTDLAETPEIASQYALMIAGSSWTEEMLRANGAGNVAKLIQGVDLSLFHPAPRSGALEGRFVVFSGGKMELRKGQDLVILAFRAFAQRHPEALLVTAWHTPWPAMARTLNVNLRLAPLQVDERDVIDVPGWARDNGIDPAQIMALGAVPNHLMPRILRETDVALFPNRCESGTNLVAMECMACGVPVIVSANTGHIDLVDTGGTIPLRRQTPILIEGMGTEGWGESNVEEMVEALEWAWANREDAAARGLAGAEAMRSLHWREQVAALHQLLMGL